VSTQRYRAWRFVHPDLDTFAAGAPGLQVTATGRIAMVEERESVRQAILLLLSTRPGERVMRPLYGCDLHRLIFSPNDGTAAGMAIHYVRQALQQWEPRIDILHLDAVRSEADPGRLDIALEYCLRAQQRSESLTYSMSLTGENP
jgi:phage baseplate assembly protein W